MTMRVFGEVDGRPVHEVTLRSEAGAEAKVIGWGAVLRDLVVPAGEGRLTAGGPGAEQPRGLHPALALFRRHCGPLRQSHPRGALPARRPPPPAVPQRRPQQPARGRARLQPPALAARRIGQRLRRLDAPVSRRRPGLSRQPHGLLHLSARRRDAAGRADGGDRRGDAGQPLPALVFQSRRLAVDPGPQSAPCRRLLYADGRGVDPDRGGEGGRRHALRFPREPSRALRRRNRPALPLRHQFRAAAGSARPVGDGRMVFGPCRDAGLGGERRRHGGLDHRARPAVLRRLDDRRAGRRARRDVPTAPMRAFASNRSIFRTAPTGLTSPPPS